MVDGGRCQPRINPELNSRVEDAPVPRTYVCTNTPTGCESESESESESGPEPEPARKEPTMIFIIRRLIRLFKQRKQQGN